MTATAVLVLEDGTRYVGRPYGAQGRTLGEAVFATGMTGYQETLTDPSRAGQIVLMTAPHIGITGVNDEDSRSARISVAGFVVRDPSRTVSNFRATGTLDEQLVAQGIVGISGIDTRAVTIRLRDAGVMRAGIFSGPDAELSHDEQLELVRTSQQKLPDSTKPLPDSTQPPAESANPRPDANKPLPEALEGGSL